MRREILRMERLTYVDHGARLLDNLHFQMFAGEIMGLVPLDSGGLEAFLQVLCENRPLLYGHVFLDEKMVNSYSGDYESDNNVQIIDNESGLVDYLSAADNVFALRKGYRGVFTREKIFRDQLRMMLREFGIDLPPSKLPHDMTVFERYVTEIMKAMVGGVKIVVLKDPGSVINPDDLERLFDLLPRCAAKGMSFIYISLYRQELAKICDRISFLAKGRTVKVVPGEELTEELMKHYSLASGGNTWESEPDHAESILRFRDVSEGKINSISFSVHRGECLVIHDYGRQIEDDLIRVLEGKRPAAGEISGLYTENGRKRKIAVILEDPAENMIFGEMSYEDNFFIGSDRKVRRIWYSRKTRRKLVRDFLGEELPQCTAGSLSPEEKYRLAYMKMLLIKPDIIFCFHPFQNADMQIGEQIRNMMRRLLGEQIALVIVTVSSHEVLQLADRLLVVRGGTAQAMRHVKRGAVETGGRSSE